ncbi:hypothetical protein ACFLY9_00150 [Patescibacteria group bacterium]
MNSFRIRITLGIKFIAVLSLVLCFQFIIIKKVEAVSADPLKHLPSGKTTPDKLGWSFIGASSGGYKCYDLADYGVKKVRYVMFLNDSNDTPWDVRGADPDGVLVLHAKNPAYNGSGANAVSHVKIGAGGVGGKGCNHSKHLSKVLGPPQRCGTTKGCACALGHDPEPGQYGGESGYLILDIACSKTNGLYCSSIYDENSNRVIVDRPGNDFCMSEVGSGESHRLYALDYYLDPPTVTVDKPGDCAEEFTFTITATDDEDQGISEITIKLNNEVNNEVSGPWVINSSRNGVDLANGGGNDFGAEVISYSEPSSKKSELKLKVTNLNGKFNGMDVTVKAEVKDKRDNVGKVDVGSFVTGNGPNVSITSIERDNGGLKVNWSYSDAGVNLPTNSCSVRIKPIGAENWEGYIDVNCSARSYTFAGYVGGTIEFRGCNKCNCNYTTEVIGPPWFMTAFGDSYSHGGYSGLNMQQANDYNVPKISGNAFFSTYIISAGNTTLPSDRESFSGYLLKSYSDSNRDNIGYVGADYKVYNYLESLYNSNQTGCIASLGNITTDGSCNGYKIYFVQGSVTLSGGWLNQQPNSSNACIIIAKGNINISGTSDGSTDNVDAFLITDSTFITETSTDKLRINGSVISRSAEFNRANNDSLENPAEIITYDPKYLDIFKSCLGEGYPLRIREYRYGGV